MAISYQPAGLNRQTADLDMRTVILSGMEAGIISGMFMMGAALVESSLLGLGFWTPLKLIAATWFGREALPGNFVIVFAGALTHIAASAIWGGVFGLFVGRGARFVSASAVIGLLIGFISWLVMTYFVLPWANPLMAQGISAMSDWWLVDHILFGAGLTLTAYFSRVPESEWYKLHQRTPHWP